MSELLDSHEISTNPGIEYTIIYQIQMEMAPMISRFL